MNWNHLEKPDPLTTMQKGREKPYRVAWCEVCGVAMQPDEIAYSGPRWCVDCHEFHADVIEKELRNG